LLRQIRVEFVARESLLLAITRKRRFLNIRPPFTLEPAFEV
jgi:hypothetical protein